jgi:hypothetical protein
MANIQKNAAIQTANNSPKHRNGARLRTRISPGAEKESVGFFVEGRW